MQTSRVTKPKKLWAVLVVLCWLAAAGCSAEVSVAARNSSDTADDPQESELAGFSVFGSLAQIPLSATSDAASPLQVSVADLDAAADQARVRRPLDTTETEDLVAFFGPLTGRPSGEQQPRLFVPLPRLFADGAILGVDGFVGEVGFSPGDITTFVAFESPPAEFVVVGGVAAVPGLTEVAPGVGTVGQGEDFAVDVQQRSAARPLGRPLRIAERDGLVALSRATDPLVDWLGTSPTATLADNDVLASVASRLDEESVVSALLTTSDNTIYTGVGIGWLAESEPRGVIVLAYDSDAAALEQRPLIEAGLEAESLSSDLLMSELVTVDAVTVRGSQIVVTMRFPDDRPPSTILDLFFRRDIPFAAPD